MSAPVPGAVLSGEEVVVVGYGPTVISRMCRHLVSRKKCLSTCHLRSSLPMACVTLRNTTLWWQGTTESVRLCSGSGSGTEITWAGVCGTDRLLGTPVRTPSLVLLLGFVSFANWYEGLENHEILMLTEGLQLLQFSKGEWAWRDGLLATIRSKASVMWFLNQNSLYTAMRGCIRGAWGRTERISH